MNRLITFGCSYSKDNYQIIWPDLVAKQLNLTLDNKSERGSGADYISKRLLSSELDPETDLVVILWPGADRYDLWADASTPHLLADADTSSWLDGKQPILVDYNGNYRNDKGFILNGSVPRGYKHKYFKYFYSPSQVVNSWYTSIVLTQLYLKSKNIRHVMATAFPLRYPVQYHHDMLEINEKIYANIDQSVFVDDSESVGFYTYCEDNHLPFLNQHYPNTESHQIWVDNFLLPVIKRLEG